MSPLRPLRLIRDDSSSRPARARGEDQGADDRNLIIRAAKAGDVRAFATLVDMYYARCLRFAMNMLFDRFDAEEAVQDTFVRVHRALPRYREDASFDPWLFRILANRCRTASANGRRRAEFVRYGEVPEPPSATHHDFALGWREEIALALAALPAEQREAFLMRHVEDMSYDQMSLATGDGISALKMRVKRACDTLRVMLTEEAND